MIMGFNNLSATNTTQRNGGVEYQPAEDDDDDDLVT